MGGVRTIADLKDRCRIDGDGLGDDHCWLWGGGISRGFPSLWMPDLGRVVTLGTAICFLRTGNPPKPGSVWHCTCQTPNCANPEHRTQGTRSTQMLAAKMQRSALTCARIAATKRAKSSLSDESCGDIRASDEPLHVVAERHGISPSHASKIRRGQLRLPLGARGASVFNLGSDA